MQAKQIETPASVDNDSTQSRNEELIQELPPESALHTILAEKRGLSTYVGVFRPTILTILGVIMYVRMGWIVGNAGLLGALLILLLTFLITGTAALAFSSITTNIRLRAGGVFALVSQSLGLEAGGAVGVPLYLAQSLGAALYIYGFAEGWQYLFPTHDKHLVVAGIFAVTWCLSLISETLALRLQAIVLVGIILALSSMFAGFWSVETIHRPQLWGEFQDGSIWLLFAIFFPAGTGIKVGASLSGKLKDPRRSIPVGTLSAWATALVCYMILIVWYAVVASPEELSSNYLIATERAFWGPAVIIGLLSSCFSATLSSLVAAPNVLCALGSHKIVPKSAFLAKESKGGTPRNAMLINGLIVGCTLLLGDLNRVAAVITMFFLITYATLNIVVLVEQSLGLLSFRPTFKVPIWVPTLGTISSLLAIVITNPLFGLISLGFVGSLYVYLERRHLETPWETVRSGLFIAVADWAARQAQRRALEGKERAWKPDILVPVGDGRELRGQYRLLLSLLKPKGSLQALLVNSEDRPTPSNQTHLEEIITYFRAEELFATHSKVDAQSIAHGTSMGISILKGNFFRPNLLFINTNYRTSEETSRLLDIARHYRMGAALLILHEQSLLGRERVINIWIRDQSPDWTLGLRLANLDLAILLGYQLRCNWQGHLNLVSAISEPGNVLPAKQFLQALSRDARLPTDTSLEVHECGFEDALESASRADINIFGLSHKIGLDRLRELSSKTHASCLFVLDSGEESALA